MPTLAFAMSEPLAAWLARTSWQVAVLVAIFAVVQVALGKLLAPRWRYALWMLIIVRLLMPVLPASSWSVFNISLPQASKVVANRADGVAKPQAADGVTVSVVRTFDGASELASIEPRTVAAAPVPFEWRRALLAVWLAGVILLALRVVVAHVRLTRRLRRAPPVESDVLDLLHSCQREMRVRGIVRVIPTEAVGGPALFGFVRPSLLVPPAMLRDLPRTDLRFVFLHELAHLKRRDTLLNIPLTLAQAIHWFNPLVWFALSRCRTERELACDAMVLEVADAPGAQQSYGQTMLRLAESLCPPRGRRRIVPAALGILETRSQLARRITMISAFRRTSSSRRWSLLPALLLMGVASCALTDKASEPPATQPSARTTVAAETRDVTHANATGAAPADPAAAPPPAEDAAGVDVETARMNNLLDRRFPELDFQAEPFEDVINYLREKTEANIFVNWRALEAEGIARTALVNLKLRDVRFRKALDAILRDVGGGTIALGYSIDDGTITITTESDLSRNTLTRVYDIRDLITDVPDYAPPTDAAAGAPAQAQAPAQPQPTTQPRAGLVEQITQLIQETVQPEAWRDAGGTVGAIRELSGQLIITATAQMHEDIGKLLHMIREARGVQLTVEMRFFAADPTDVDKALGGRLLGTMGKSGQATVWHLSDAQVQAVLRQLQQTSNSTIVTAPRITLFNGQRGMINVSAETPYTAGYTVFKKDGGETRYEPTIDKVASGIFIDVRGTASADRKQATLTIHPKFSFLQALRPAPYVGSKDLTVQVPQLIVHELQTTLSLPDRGTALIGGFTESGGASAASAAPSASATARVEGNEIVLEQPVKTRVKVPDGGKIVLGGSEPPITSPAEGVPFLRRLGGDLDRSQNLFLLVKPTLVITQPQAPKEFPPLSTSPRR